MAQSIDLKALADRLPQIARQAGATGPAADPVRQAAKTLAMLGIDLEKNILNAFGNEIGFFIEPGEPLHAMLPAPKPVMGLLFSVKDQPNLQPVVELVLGMLKEIPFYKSDNIETVSNGFEVTTLRYAIPTKTFINSSALTFMMPKIEVDIAVITKGPLFGIVTSREVALRALSTNGPSFKDSENFKPLTAVDLKGTAGLIYMNTPLLVDTYYPIIIQLRF
jgi:hypothetical protein